MPEHSESDQPRPRANLASRIGAGRRKEPPAEDGRQHSSQDPGLSHDHDSREHSHQDEHGSHDHGNEHQQDGHGQEHGHDHPPSRFGWLSQLLPFFHGHDHSGPSLDDALEGSDKGIHAVKISLVLLGITAAFQVAVVIASGSVALLADTNHNFTDALTALPLWLAFALSRRPASRRFTYGMGRAEDLAGVFVVLIILASALVAGYESYRKIIDPSEMSHVGWVIAAAIVGFIGNEVVAVFRTRVGKEIGSAALVADGQHARVDGLTSLAVLIGAFGTLAGAPILDPIVGALITVAILFIVKDAALMIWHRLMDAVDPQVVHELEQAAAQAIEGVAGAHKVEDFRVRWLGHKLQAELNLTVDEDMSTKDSHQCAEEVRHALFHTKPQLTSVIVHVEPDGHGGDDPHRLTQHHRDGGIAAR
jgi:cation diffusion facilitator family transporter